MRQDQDKGQSPTSAEPARVFIAATKANATIDQNADPQVSRPAA
jgi:hypothetical protein